MANSNIKKLLHQQMTRKEFLAFGALAAISIFGLIGVLEELLSHAATPYATNEAETGTRAGTTALATKTGSASNQVVQFGTVPTSGTSPAYSPPGGVGALIYNFDPSTMSDGSLNSPILRPFTGSVTNNETIEPEYVNIVNGQLVLTLPVAEKGGQAGAVTSYGATDQFYITGGCFLECSMVVPDGGWWCIWLSAVNSAWPADGEFDIAENGFFSGAGSSDGVGITTGFVYSGNTEGALTPDVGWNPQPTPGETIVVGGLWQPGESITSYMNGTQKVHIAGSFITNGPMAVMANIGYNGSSGANGDTYKINYIRCWDLP